MTTVSLNTADVHTLWSCLAALMILCTCMLGSVLARSLAGGLSEYVVGEAHPGRAIRRAIIGSMAVTLAPVIAARALLLRHMQANQAALARQA